MHFFVILMPACTKIFIEYFLLATSRAFYRHRFEKRRDASNDVMSHVDARISRLFELSEESLNANDHECDQLRIT